MSYFFTMYTDIPVTIRWTHIRIPKFSGLLLFCDRHSVRRRRQGVDRRLGDRRLHAADLGARLRARLPGHHGGRRATGTTAAAVSTYRQRSGPDRDQVET